MKRRTALKISVALLVVLTASLSTVRARQAWGEQQAHSRFVSAQKSASVALAHAAGVGLLPSELNSYRTAKSKLDAAPAPGDSILWGSQESYYDRQAAAYYALIARIHRQIARVRSETRIQASSALAGLAAAIGRARTYDIDVSSASAKLARERTLSGAAGTPRDYRAIITATGPIRDSVQRATDARARIVSGVLRTAGNTVTAIFQRADADVNGVQTQLSLISIFSKQGKQLADQISTGASTVHAQTTAFDAAVKEATLHDLVGGVSALMQKVVPSKVIVVSTEDQWARMYENGQEVYNTAVTTGGPELPTDHGVFHIYEKITPFVFHSPWPEGSPYYYPPTPISYWMPFDGAQGLHDASWRSNFGPGSNFQPTDLGTGNYILGTHGCVNLPFDAATWVWNWAPLGTTVVVV